MATPSFSRRIALMRFTSFFINMNSCSVFRQRLATLLPIPYFHVVFTLPHELNALALGNQTLLFNILFASVARTLQEVAATPRHLGAEIGLTAVLHSWGQNVLFHPHLHC